MTLFLGVIMCDNYFTSGPLLAKDDVYLVGTINQRASGFPNSLIKGKVLV